MVGIPTADEFMKHKEEFDATIDNASDDLNAGLLLVSSLLSSVNSVFECECVWSDGVMVMVPNS